MRNRIDLRLLKYFMVTSEQASLTRAAQVLNLAQPALSRQIKLLEDELGLTLFHRLPRGMHITPAGERLLVHVKEIMARMVYLHDDMEQLAQGHLGAIEVGLSPVALDNLLIRGVFDSHARLSPQVELKLHNRNSSHQVGQLKQLKQDVGFLYLERPDPMLASVVLDQQKLVLGMSEQHPLATAEYISIEDLRPFGFIRTTSFISSHLEEILRAHSYEPRIAQETNDTRMLLQLVAANQGLAFVNSTWSHASSGVILREVEEVNVPLPLSVCRRTLEDRVEVLKFFDHAVRTAISQAPSMNPASRCLQSLQVAPS